MATELCEFTKNHLIVHLEGLDFILCKLHVDQAAQETPANSQSIKACKT